MIHKMRTCFLISTVELLYLISFTRSNIVPDQRDSLGFINQAVQNNALPIQLSRDLQSRAIQTVQITMDVRETNPDKTQDRFLRFSIAPDCKHPNGCPDEIYSCSMGFLIDTNSHMKVNYSECKKHNLVNNNQFIDGQNNRKKRGIDSSRLFTIPVPGNEMPQVTEMANFAMQTLDQIDVDGNKRKVVGVIDAKKQLTPDGSGIMYYLDVNTQDTQCAEDLPGDEPSYPSLPDDCLDKTIGQVKMCKITLLRSWVPNSSPVNAHVVKSECGPPDDAER
uniref:Cystatin domain-containing protein n=1 Tax=Cacopsylla melanoneura TaxID=428564 RepID=A0A8D9E712_9HEMI